MKKAQSTQIYVVVGIIFLFGIVFGFKLVYDFLQTAEKLRLADFQTRLSGDIKTMSSKLGSVTKSSYNLPSGISLVCFYDSNAEPGGNLPNNPLLTSLIKEGKNVFLWQGFDVKGIAAENFETSTDYYCMNVTNSQISLLMQGTGGKALIKKSG